MLWSWLKGEYSNVICVKFSVFRSLIPYNALETCEEVFHGPLTRQLLTCAAATNKYGEIPGNVGLF